MALLSTAFNAIFSTPRLGAGLAVIGAVNTLLLTGLWWRLAGGLDVFGTDTEPERSTTLCEWVLAGQMMLLFGFLTFALGGYYEIAVLQNVTRLIGLVYTAILAAMFYRWVST